MTDENTISANLSFLAHALLYSRQQIVNNNKKIISNYGKDYWN